MKVQEKHGKVTQNMHGASRNYRYVWDISVPRSCRAAHEVSKVEHKEGRRTSHSYCSWTHGPRWTTHGTSGRRPWRWKGSRRWFPFRQGAGAASPGSPDLQMAAAEVQRGDWEKNFDPRGFL